MSKYSFEEFLDRIKLSEMMYRSLEDRMYDYLDFVSLDLAHLDVYSLKLVSIILETGPEIINSFDLNVFSDRTVVINHFTEDRQKLLEKEKSLRKQNNSLTFKNYTDFLNKSMSLSTIAIEIMGLNAYTLPFKEGYPEWWEAYNQLRHDKYNHLKKATLKNALKALGAFSLLKEQYTAGVVDRGDRLGINLFDIVYNIENIRNQQTEI